MRFWAIYTRIKGGTKKRNEKFPLFAPALLGMDRSEEPQHLRRRYVGQSRVTVTHTRERGFRRPTTTEQLYFGLYGDLWASFRTWLYSLGCALFVLGALVISLWIWWLIFYTNNYQDIKQDICDIKEECCDDGNATVYDPEELLCTDIGLHADFDCFNNTLCEEIGKQNTSLNCFDNVNITNCTGTNIIVKINQTITTLRPEEICPESCEDGVAGVNGTDGVCTQNCTDGLRGPSGFNGTDGVCPESCNATLCECDNFIFPNVTDAPCICGDPGCDFNTIWFCPIDGSFYYCDSLSSTWLHVGPPVSLEGEQDVACNFGMNPTDDSGCAVAWGAAVGIDDDTPRNGLFIYNDFTVVSYGISIDDASECSTGSYDVMVCWTSGPLDDADFALANCTDIATGLTTDAANSLDIRIEVPGHRYIVWGLENNCNGGGVITDWNVHLMIKYRAPNP